MALLSIKAVQISQNANLKNGQGIVLLLNKIADCIFLVDVLVEWQAMEGLTNGLYRYGR